MINNKTCLAIIPARGGSKRLPKENISLLFFLYIIKIFYE